MSNQLLHRRSVARDVISLVLFVVCVIIGTLFINAFIFRSFNVVGPSMQPTLYTGDRLIVNRLPVTWAQLQNEQYVPDRGQVIVFKNPNFDDVANREEYIVKRVIAFEDERVVLEDGSFTVYNDKHPNGFDPDKFAGGEPKSPTSGQYNGIVPDDTIFVSGDNRVGNYSLDSRNGLGTIPLYDIIGPVALRIYPFDRIRTF